MLGPACAGVGLWPREVVTALSLAVCWDQLARGSALYAGGLAWTTWRGVPIERLLRDLPVACPGVATARKRVVGVERRGGGRTIRGLAVAGHTMCGDAGYSYIVGYAALGRATSTHLAGAGVHASSAYLATRNSS